MQARGSLRQRGRRHRKRVRLGRVLRRQGAWKFRAVGQGYGNGLEGPARDGALDVNLNRQARGQFSGWSSAFGRPAATHPEFCHDSCRRRQPSSGTASGRA
ncbi:MULTISPECIES: TerD family protein [unclassified Streptomyces]|uniref:TerD family protein n=1 Tax=unclassified Streptomyces TaxID=2593676 RepID=UPI003B63AA56